MNDIKSLLKQYEEVNAELNKQIKENGKEFIASVFQEIFDKHEGLKLVLIRGWTPGFNDGEPCTHRQESFVGSSHTWSYRGEECLSYDFDDRELYKEFEVEFDEEDSDTIISHINSGCSTLDQVYEDVETYSEIIERVFNTDFEIQVTLDDNGKVVVSDDEYCCGY